MAVTDLFVELGDLGRGIRMITARNAGPLTLDGSRTYLVGLEDGVLIDPGPAGPDQQARLDELVAGVRVRLVCLTHAHSDHSGAAAGLAARLGCQMAASADTLSRLQLPGRELKDGDQIPIDGGASTLRVLATPGHTADHLSFMTSPGRQLFTGDTVLGTGTSVILHPDGQVGAYLDSLERLIAEHPAVILPGHGPPVTRPLQKLRGYLRHRREREEQIIAALAALDDDQARSLAAIREAVYGRLPEGLCRAADSSVRAHLKHIEASVALPPIRGYSDRDVDTDGGALEA